MSRRQPLACDTDSSSEDEDIPSCIETDRYQAADIARGLQSREWRQAALLELKTVLDNAYKSRASKAAIYEDVLLAVRLTDGRKRIRDAVAAVADSAKRVLPHAKRSSILAEHKRASVTAARRQSRSSTDHGNSITDDDAEGEEEDHVQFEHMPLEVVLLIFKALGPLMLAQASCVCRSWQQLASGDDLWQPLLVHIFPNNAAQQQQPEAPRPRQPHQQQQQQQEQEQDQEQQQTVTAAGAARRFARQAERHPLALLPWRACRVLLNEQLDWHVPGSLLPARTTHAPGQPVRRRRPVVDAYMPGPHLLHDPEQVLGWLLGLGARALASRTRADGSSSSGGSSGEDGGELSGGESHTVGALRRRLWVLAKAG